MINAKSCPDILPMLNKPFTVFQDALLIDAAFTFQKRWIQVKDRVPGRTAEECRLRFEELERAGKAVPFSSSPNAPHPLQSKTTKTVNPRISSGQYTDEIGMIMGEPGISKKNQIQKTPSDRNAVNTKIPLQASSSEVVSMNNVLKPKNKEAAKPHWSVRDALYSFETAFKKSVESSESSMKSKKKSTGAGNMYRGIRPKLNSRQSSAQQASTFHSSPIKIPEYSPFIGDPGKSLKSFRPTIPHSSPIRNPRNSQYFSTPTKAAAEPLNFDDIFNFADDKAEPKESIESLFSSFNEVPMDGSAGAINSTLDTFYIGDPKPVFDIPLVQSLSQHSAKRNRELLSDNLYEPSVELNSPGADDFLDDIFATEYTPDPQGDGANDSDFDVIGSAPINIPSISIT
jgi:hypothetical protein